MLERLPESGQGVDSHYILEDYKDISNSFSGEDQRSPEGQGVDSVYINLEDNKDNSKSVSGKCRKRKRKSQLESASPVLAKKSRTGDKTLAEGDISPCGVCGAKSTGAHYGCANACEGCKGFFRRRVMYRDISSYLCGSGGQCKTSGRSRIHCKVCRYKQCIDIGMKPENVKHEDPDKTSNNLTFEQQVLRFHKETLTPLPAIYSARQHLEKANHFVAREWPVTADLGPLTSPASGPADSLRFIESLPGWEELRGHDQQWAAHTGSLQVMLVRLLARWRPEVGAFLFPCGQFVFPGQMRGSLPEKAVHYLPILAAQFTSLTQQELSLISALVATNPLSPCSLYKATLAAISETRSGLHLLALSMQVSELFLMACTDHWQNVSIN